MVLKWDEHSTRICGVKHYYLLLVSYLLIFIFSKFRMNFNSTNDRPFNIFSLLLVGWTLKFDWFFFLISIYRQNVLQIKSFFMRWHGTKTGGYFIISFIGLKYWFWFRAPSISDLREKKDSNSNVQLKVNILNIKIFRFLL